MSTVEHGSTGLRTAAVARRVDALFKAMSMDFLLREQFVTDPAQVMAEYVRGARLSPAQTDLTNQFLYALVSNPGLVRWVRDYTLAHRGEALPVERYTADFGRAVIENDAQHVVVALMRGSGSQEGIVGLDDSLLTILVDSGIFSEVVVTEVSGTHTDPLTESSGTHVSTGTGGTDPLTEVSGTHISSEPSEVLVTEVSGTHTDPLTESSGTHVSTGTGGTDPLTEVSGTHMSTGTLPEELTEIFGTGYQAVTLVSLVRYAITLRDRGLLGSAGLPR